jgi:hypothetical protein
MALLKTLPFYRNAGYAEQIDAQYLGLPELGDRYVAAGADDDIPF